MTIQEWFQVVVAVMVGNAITAAFVMSGVKKRLAKGIRIDRIIHETKE